MYDLLLDAWHPTAESRPTTGDFVERLRKIRDDAKLRNDVCLGKDTRQQRYRSDSIKRRPPSMPAETSTLRRDGKAPYLDVAPHKSPQESPYAQPQVSGGYAEAAPTASTGQYAEAGVRVLPVEDGYGTSGTVDFRPMGDGYSLGDAPAVIARDAENGYSVTAVDQQTLEEVSYIPCTSL